MTSFPPQQKPQPGRREPMEPKPELEQADYRPSGKLKDKTAVVTGGDSGIGAATAIAFAKEGAHCVVVYLEEHDDAKRVCERITELDRRCIGIAGDVGDESFCRHVVDECRSNFGRIDILVNNAGEQHSVKQFEEISSQQWERTFRSNVFSMFYMIKHSLPIMDENSCIINTTSVTAYQGHPSLIDYSSTKGAIVAFTRSSAVNLAKRGIRVNGVAPGPVWTPLIPASFSEGKVEEFGESTPMNRAGQPSEIAPCYVFLASNDAAYMTGQVLHPNGGRIVNG